MRPCHILVSMLLATCALPRAQVTLVIPPGTGTVAGNSANLFPWGWSAANFAGLRHQNIYDANNFILQGVTTPIVITRLRWRPDENAPAVTGGTFQQAVVQLSTAPMDYRQQTLNFVTNHGADKLTAYSGPVVHTPTPGAAAWTPQSWCIDIQLTTPFYYDPAAGDLVVDCDYAAGSWLGGTLGSMDVLTLNSFAGRTWGSSSYPNADGTWLDHGVVLAVDYAPATAGHAFAAPFGVGCLEAANATVYELFAAGGFDLSGTSWRLLPAGGGYVIGPATPAWYPATGAAIPLFSSAVSGPQSLGFTLAYPGGTTTTVWIASNGFVWPIASSNSGAGNPNPADLLTLGPRWCPLWSDLDPGAGGQVQFDVDAQNGAAYVTFTNVPERFAANTVSFQVAMFATGVVEYHFGSCTLTNHPTLTGWSPGVACHDPGSVDLSAAGVLVTSPDLDALHHSASARPLLGSVVQLRTTSVAATAVLGATIAGLTAHDPGIDLTPFGMPSCRQFVAADAIAAWIPQNGIGATAFAIPSAPSLAGIRVHSQGAALVPGVNVAGAVASNGLHLVIDAN